MSIENLRDLCAAYWNPIGVVMSNEPDAQNLPHPPLPADEYDGYLFAAWQMVRDGSSSDEIVSYLAQVESEYLGLSRPSGNKWNFVNALMELASQEPQR